MTAASGKLVVEQDQCRFSAVQPKESNPWILNEESGHGDNSWRQHRRLQRETVDLVHEQIKYFFRFILLRKWYRWTAVNSPSGLPGGVEESCAFIDVSGTFCHPVKTSGTISRERGR